MGEYFFSEKTIQEHV